MRAGADDEAGVRHRPAVNVPETELLAALRALETAVASARGPGPAADVRPLLHRLDELARALPPDASPDLRHYLHKRSYEKARRWLEGQDPEAGACPRHV
jgi:hypothetical protein